MTRQLHVPEIDLSAFRNGATQSRRNVARVVDQALRDIGFLIITGHGVPVTMVNDIDRVSRNFFDLPLSERMAVHNTVDGAFRGYVAEGDETFSYTLNESSPPDIKESFVIGRFETDDSAYFHKEPATAAFASNVYPSSPLGMRNAYERYYLAMEQLVATLLECFAVALDLPAAFFETSFNRHASTLRATNYPHQTGPALPGQLRAGEHTDYGAITILAIEDKPGGLEVRATDGQWLEVPAVPGSFVVNIGDLMMNWTNDYWLSNLHRVSNPEPDADNSTRRQSLVYFANPNYDALIECLPTCLKPGETAKYPALTAGEHRRKKIEKSATQVLKHTDT